MSGPERSSVMLFRKKNIKTYDSSVCRPVLHKSICTGETTAGFKDLSGGAYHEVMLIRSEEDLKKFMEAYGLQEKPETEY